MRRAVVARFGGLDESMHYCMDYDYWLRIGRSVRLEHLPTPLACLRLYDECKSLRAKPAAIREHFRMFLKHFGRAPETLIGGSGVVAAEQCGLDRKRLDQEAVFMCVANAVMHANRARYNRRFDAARLAADLKYALDNAAPIARFLLGGRGRSAASRRRKGA